MLRAFELEGATVRDPFNVNLPTGIGEQIDGVIYHPLITARVEPKDRDTVPLAKPRSQLMRRPDGVVGIVFCRRRLRCRPPRWPGSTRLRWCCCGQAEIDLALRRRRIIDALTTKYRAAVELSVFDSSLLQGGQP